MDQFPNGTRVQFEAEVHIEGMLHPGKIDAVVVEQQENGCVVVEFIDPATGADLKQTLFPRQLTVAA